MNKKININNRKRITVLIVFLFVLLFFTVLLPFWFVNYLSLSGLGNFFAENFIYSMSSLVIFIYFAIVGNYYYKIEIDNYVIQVISFRVFVGFFRKKDYVDIPHEMLVDYKLFKKSFSFNRTLMLKILTQKKKIIVKKFNLTLISENEENKIRSRLNYIIENNK